MRSTLFVINSLCLCFLTHLRGHPLCPSCPSHANQHTSPGPTLDSQPPSHLQPAPPALQGQETCRKPAVLLAHPAQDLTVVLASLRRWQSSTLPCELHRHQPKGTSQASCLPSPQPLLRSSSHLECPFLPHMDSRSRQIPRPCSAPALSARPCPIRSVSPGVNGVCSWWRKRGLRCRGLGSVLAHCVRGAGRLTGLCKPPHLFPYVQSGD